MVLRTTNDSSFFEGWDGMVMVGADSLDTRIDDEGMNGTAETAQAREALERMQALSPEVSEELDAYQQWHACYAKKQLADKQPEDG